MKERRYDIDWLRDIAVVSFALIMTIYELLIRRFNIVRFFFGMRPKKKPSTKPAPRPEGTAA